MFRIIGSVSGFSLNFLTLTEGNPNKKAFLEKGKVKRGSYAEQLLSRIFDLLTAGTLDVQQQYHEYYAAEYATLEDYLVIELDIGQELAKTVAEAVKRGKKAALGQLSYLGDYSLASLLENPEVAKGIDKLL